MGSGGGSSPGKQTAAKRRKGSSSGRIGRWPPEWGVVQGEGSWKGGHPHTAPTRGVRGERGTGSASGLCGWLCLCHFPGKAMSATLRMPTRTPMSRMIRIRAFEQQP
eukprot:1359298-Alexandrium_andersonii.AAC.1